MYGNSSRAIFLQYTKTYAKLSFFVCLFFYYVIMHTILLVKGQLEGNSLYTANFAKFFNAYSQHQKEQKLDGNLIIDIAKWAQEYFQKPLLVNTICHAICRCQLKLYHAKSKPYVNMVQKRHCVLWAKAHLKWTVSKWKVFHGQT